ncbi:hypothetical protein D3C85_1389850 [compost metagenome]
MLFADQAGDFRLVLLQQLLEAEQHLGALGRRGVAPGRESSLGGIDGLLDGGAAGQAQRAVGFAGGRVEHGGRAALLGDAFAVDQVRDDGHGWGLL